MAEVAEATGAMEWIAKILGYGILASNTTLKVPQIRKVVQAKATTGLSAMALYLDVFLYLNAAMYNITMGNPLSAWGELLIVIVQNVALVLLLWRYSLPAPSLAAKAGAVLMLAAHVAISLNLPPGYRYLLPTLNLPCMIITRIAQIRKNMANGHTGLLSTTSLIMNISTVLVRVFTTVVLVGWDWNILRAYGLSVTSNGVLLGQIAYYGANTSKVMAEQGQGDEKKGR
mmetsp:Transcript_19489/g.51160  ORF Transcript_19489/g.51160 Transcript_19489/m.51160 type:complete len:229 (+) Transcript_19489:141-827(+)